MIKKTKTVVLVAVCVCAIGLFTASNKVISQNSNSNNSGEDCTGKGKVIILSEDSTSQIHAVYDFEAGKLTTFRVSKDGYTITKRSTQNLR